MSQVEPEMSSLVKEDLEKKLFKPLAQNLCEFIEIEFSVQDRYYLCVSGKQRFLVSFQNAENSKVNMRYRKALSVFLSSSGMRGAS